MASKRVLRELKEMQNDPINPFNPRVVDEDLFHWEATVTGPPNSPYAGGLFIVDIKFSRDYPSKPPEVTFKTKVFHLSVNSDGYIWHDFMNTGWSPAMTVSKALLSICSIMIDPKPDNFIGGKTRDMYDTDRARYDSTARSWTQMYAMG